MKPQAVISDISSIIRLAIEAGLSDQQRYPALRKVGHNDYDIYIDGAPDLSASMKGKPYDQIYESLSRGGAFNLRMIDGSLIQMLYTFRKGVIFSHRLAVFPSPHLEIYEEAQQDYEDDLLYAEIVEKSLIKFPIRFDFSGDESIHLDVAHPKSHLTLGQYSNCRIPVSAPLTPIKFMSFVVRNFYNPALQRVKFSRQAVGRSFDETITSNERKVGFFTY